MSKIIEYFRYAVKCWDWARVNRYYEQYPGLHGRFDRELADLEHSDKAHTEEM